MILKPGWKTSENLHTVAGCAAAALLAVAGFAAGAIAVAIIVASYNLARGIAKIGKTKYNSVHEAEAHLAGVKLNYEEFRLRAEKAEAECGRLQRERIEREGGAARPGGGLL